jgi:hypothetical protein
MFIYGPLRHIGWLLQSILTALDATFHPLGFPVRILTNSQEVLDAARTEWEPWRQAFSEPSITVRVNVTGTSSDRPPASTFHASGPAFEVISDAGNRARGDTHAGEAVADLTPGAVQNGAWLQYHFLDALVFQLITSPHLTPIHASAVARHGRATLLAGNSHAGKSSLAYACARRGWTYISDDSSPLLRRCVSERLVLGTPHSLRLRPDAPKLFPELAPHPTTLRGNGKTVLQIPTCLLPIETAPTASAARFVLLDRRPGPTRLAAAHKSRVVNHCAQHFYHWDPPILRAQRAAFDTMLDGMELLSLKYSNIDEAIDVLEK